MSRFNLWPVAAFLLLTPLLLVAQPPRVIDDKLYYLGTPGDPEWEEFAGRTPHGRRLDVNFTAHANTNENTLFVRQRDVKLEWGIELNGKKLGRLFLSEQDLIQALPLPAGALHEGENTLSVLPPKDRDDVEVGEIKLDSRPVKAALNEQKKGSGLYKCIKTYQYSSLTPFPFKSSSPFLQILWDGCELTPFINIARSASCEAPQQST